MSRAGADDELSWVVLDQLVHSDLVVSEHMDRGTLENKVLIDVPSE